METVKFRRLHPDAKLPQPMTDQAAGLDIYANLVSESGQPSKMLIPALDCRAVPTGLAIEPPPTGLIQVVSRSGLARDFSLFVANAPGIIDTDYRGELMVLLYNGSRQSFYVQHHMRVGQLIWVQNQYIRAVEVDELSPSTSRGSRGFGSTGL